MFNKVMLVGNLGADPKALGDNGASFSIACNERWKDKATGDLKEEVTWVNVVTFGPMAKTWLEHLSKGQRVLVDGKIRNNNWEDEDGNMHYDTQVYANTFRFLTPKSDEDQPF
jgi:single-strand DNA-binding protein